MVLRVYCLNQLTPAKTGNKQKSVPVIPNMRIHGINLFLLAVFLTASVSLSANAVRDGQVEAELVTEVTSIQPGRTFTLALRLKHDEGWHTYWKNPGDAGLPTTIEWMLPEGFEAGSIQWPYPEIIDVSGIINYGYSDEIFLLVDITPPENLRSDEDVTLTARVEWLMCEVICIPGSADLNLNLPVSLDPTSGESPWSAAFDETRELLPKQLDSWEVSAYRDGNRIALYLEPTGEANPDISSLYFFSADAQVVPGAPQPLRRSGAGYVLELARTDFAEKDAVSLPGILYSAEGWLADGSMKALGIDPGYADELMPAAISIRSDSGQTAVADGNFLGVLGLAFLGGLILNLMPCVFPVLGIKIMGFVGQAGEQKGRIVMHGLVYALGILVSFWALAAALLILRAGGEELGWGFQLQSPVFVYFLTLILFVFALNLSGVFEVGGGAMGLGQHLAGNGGLAGSFFSGLLATVVATPCAAPFLAPALGAALALNSIESMVVFTFIGLGLAAPYLVLSMFPGLVKILPRPGAWMETFRQAMSFPLYASAGFLIWVLAAQTGEYGLLFALFALSLVAMAGWIYGRWSVPTRKPAVRRVAVAAALAVLGLAIYTGYPVREPSGLVWEKWSPEKVTTLRAEGRPIFVDFTARWCATCQANKAAVFSSGKIIKTFHARDVAVLKADWTNGDPAITEELARFGRSAVPFNLFYLPGQIEPVILPVILTPGAIMEALGKSPARPAGIQAEIQ